jgi:hypothetical protein
MNATKTIRTCETNSYEASHGKLPRGEGSWVFIVTHESGRESEIWLTGLYSKCRAAAIKLANGREGAYRLQIGA